MSEVVPSILVASSIAFSLWSRATLCSSRRALQRFFPALLRLLLRLDRARGHHQCQLVLFCTWSRPSSLSLPFGHSLRCITAFFTLCFSREQLWPSCAKLKAESLQGETGKSQVLVLAPRSDGEIIDDLASPSWAGWSCWHLAAISV